MSLKEKLTRLAETHESLEAAQKDHREAAARLNELQDDRETLSREAYDVWINWPRCLCGNLALDGKLFKVNECTEKIYVEEVSEL